MILCFGLQIDTTEAGIFDRVDGAIEVFSEEIWWVLGINGLADAGAIALGGIGGDILNRDRLGRDFFKEEVEESCCEKDEHHVYRRSCKRANLVTLRDIQGDKGLEREERIREKTNVRLHGKGWRPETGGLWRTLQLRYNKCNIKRISRPIGIRYGLTGSCNRRTYYLHHATLRPTARMAE